jgi:hypothetical protein
MGFLACAGYTLIGVGPPAAVFVEFVVSSPFVLLVSLASAFCWVTLFMAVSILWQIFCKLFVAFSGGGGKDGDAEGTFEGVGAASFLVLAFFCVEECLRPWVYKYSSLGISALERRAVSLRHPKLTYLEKLRIYLGIGAGQGIAHSCLFFLNTVITSYSGTYYNQEYCPQMPYFLVAAISSSTSFIVLSFAMVVTSIVFDPRAESNRMDSALPSSSHSGGGFLNTLINRVPQRLLPLSMHGVCTLVSFLNLLKGGCVASSIFNVGIVCGTLALTWKILISPQLRNSYEHLT